MLKELAIHFVISFAIGAVYWISMVYAVHAINARSIRRSIKKAANKEN